MTRRLAITVRGVVQGVGFRPFVYRIALEQGLCGWVRNRADGVRIEVQGSAEKVERFLEILKTEAPPQAAIEDVRTEELSLGDDRAFEILKSDESARARPSIPADLATCSECLAEIESPSERRHGYPFTNCTNCGPRYSIIESLPYDRSRTSMKGFTFCADCEREYQDPTDRRFHAQPVACPRCGPRLELLDESGRSLALADDALARAAQAILDGRIVALKGLGGFQLLADATSQAAVERLRARKHREAKPFAVMFGSLEELGVSCEVSDDEARTLRSPQAPILLLRRKPVSLLCASLAPHNPRVGAMLPYTPLHRLLTDRVGRAVVCTSGNLSDEPMCTGNEEAVSRLRGIADLFLVHDRPIVRPVDDSVARFDTDGLLLLRRARGFAPLPLPFLENSKAILAVGAHLKCTVALTVGDQIVVSQHLGDLDSAEGALLHERTVEDLLRFFDVRPQLLACDLHPEYISTRLAERLSKKWGVPLEHVQHHHAHVAAVMAERGVEGEILGLAWDGTGLGDDGVIWGGEALICQGARYRRIHPLRRFLLPGGDLAAREPRRSALGLLFAIDAGGARKEAERWFAKDELELLFGALSRGLHAPASTSIGRLFDGVAALCGLRAKNDFESQAAMELEFAADGIRDETAYPFPLDEKTGEADWAPLIREVISDRAAGVPVGVVGARFHEALASLAVSVARASGQRRVALGGGCFQNERLSRRCSERLSAAGFEVLRARRVPPNDGAVALGQAFVAARSGK